MRRYRVGLVHVVLTLFSLLFTLLPACAAGAVSDYDEENPYAVLGDSLSDYVAGADAMEAYHVQAEPMLTAGMAQVFDPMSNILVVIAVDSSRIDERIAGWGDLLSGEVNVSLSAKQPQLEYISAAISYGLTGEYDFRAATRYLDQLAEQGRLSFEREGSAAPVCLTLSDDVPDGWTVITPAEGTLYFEKGVLSRSRAGFAPDHDRNQDLPANAVRADAAQLERLRPMWAYVRRTYLNERRYSTASGWEHQIAALISIIVISIWLTYMNIRADSGEMRRIVTAIGCLEIGWICVRVIKYLLIGTTELGRYMWYSFYVFQTGIALMFFALAFKLDGRAAVKGVDRKPLLMFLALFGGALTCLILTNDLHQWAFSFGEGLSNWDTAYEYGAVYYSVLAYYYLLIAAALGMLLHRCRRAPRRGGAVLASLVLVGLMIYSIGYILRYPLMWESDMTLVTCCFILLFMESAFQSGLIPLSSGHRRLFRRADLGIQLLNGRGEPVLWTRDAVKIERGAREELLRAGGAARSVQSGDLCLYAAPIAGGYVVWQEDVGELTSLNRSLARTNDQLGRQQAALREEERIRGELMSLNARNRIYAEIESTVSGRLSDMRERLTGMAGADEGEARRAIARINMLAGAVKRSCGLLLREKREESVSGDDLAMALSEMVEFVGYAGVKCATLFEYLGNLPCAAARVIYECFFQLCEGAVEQANDQLIIRLYLEEGHICLLIMAHRQCLNEHRAADLRSWVELSGAGILTKDLGDMHSVLVTCQLAGGAYA